MRKYVLIVAVVGVLAIATVGTAMASHDITKTAATVPIVVIERFGIEFEAHENVLTYVPVHVIEQLGIEQEQQAIIAIPVPVHGIEHFGEGLGH